MVTSSVGCCPKCGHWAGGEKHPTRKDRRCRHWPHGGNSQSAKKSARRMLRRSKELWQGGSWKKYTGGYRYSINDFK